MKKKIMSVSLALIMCLSLSIPAFAVSAEDTNNPAESISVDIQSIDTTRPHSYSKTFNDNGKEVTIELIYEPSVQTRSGSSETPAYEGTFTTKYTGVGIGMSFKFDLSRSGSQWKISNARDHSYYGVATNFSDPSLKISRAISTNSYPAEVNSSVQASLVAEIVYSTTWLLSATVSSSGVITTYWN